MAEGIYITKTEFNQLMKEITFLKQFVVNASKPRIMHNWISEEEAMLQIGCKESKLKQLRLDNVIRYKYASKDKRGFGKGVLICRKSVEAYNEAMSKEGVH